MNNNYVINKPSIFITSSGRTGTKFFSDLFSQILSNCNSFHEPDAFTPPFNEKIGLIKKHFGLTNTFIKKFSNNHNFRSLSLLRQLYHINENIAYRSIYDLRNNFVKNLHNYIYIESNPQLNGLIDIIPWTFPNSNIIFIVRDGRDWITSFYNHSGGRYGKRDLMYKFGLGRLAASDIKDDPWHHEWKHFNQFQKQCWLWQKENHFAIESIEQCDNARWWRYEDLFYSKDKLSNFADLIEFATNFPDGTQLSYAPFEHLIDNRIHASKPGRFPSWPEWDHELALQFHQICGDLMSKLGYGDEPEWLEKINNTS